MSIGRVPGATGIQPSIVDAKGDLIVATAADSVSRLAVGSNGTVLTADSAEATGLKWATPASSGLVLINRTSYSNVASQTFDNVFSTTYKFYTIAIEQNYAATATDDLEMIMRYGTTDATSHYSLCNYYTFNSSTLRQLSVSAGAAMKLSLDAGDVSFRTSLNLTVGWVGTGSNSYPLVYGTGYSNNGSHSLWFGGYPYVGGQQYTGFKLRSSSSNITGTVSVYGWSAS